MLIAMLLAGGVTLFALSKVASDERATLVTALFTLLGTLVGAYTGVRVGAQGTEQALTTAAEVQQAHTQLAQEETIRTSELSAAIPNPAEAQAALDRAEEKIQQRRTP